MNIETQYLDLAQYVMTNGDDRMDRTGVGTRSVFGAMMRHNLAGGVLPALTTKRVFWKAAVREMLWFLTGNTNIRPLVEQGVGIWTDWPLKHYRQATGDNISQADFEQRIVEEAGFAEEWGDLGPVYGKQWRRWQGSDGKEYDQIGELIDTLRNNPSSRRMLFHGWNVSELSDMALPPCHLLYQYHVTSDGRLNSLLFQRSVDLLLGLPFNKIGQAVLQSMIAQQAGLELGEMVWVGGDVHIYSNHFDQIAEQMTRKPRELPKLKIKRKPESIDDYKFEDFEVIGYDPHPAIQAEVAV